MYADVANYQDSTSGRVGLSGALVNIDEQWFLGRRISSSYGVVKLPELSNVRVYVNNQLTARTDELGYALLPNLHTYIKNHVSVEQLDLPLDTKIDSLLTRPVPMWRRGVIIKFPIRKVTEALGVMRGKRIRRLPVVNRDGGLVGMVTTDNLLDLLAAELSMLAGLVVEQPIKEERTRK